MSEELGTEVPLDREQGHENHAWLVLSWRADLLSEQWGRHRQGGAGRVSLVEQRLRQMGKP